MAGKSRPSLRVKTLQNVATSNLSMTDKQCIQSVFEKFEAMSTADVVEVKHGKYVYSSTDGKWHCFECFAERPRNNGDIPYSDIYCCYKCGAIMDGKEETEDA